MSKSRTITSISLAVMVGVLVLIACARLDFERVDYKAYPTVEDIHDFYGRVYARTRIEEVKVHPVSSAEQASQQVGFPVLLPAYLPDDLKPVDKLIITQPLAYQVDVDMNTARDLLQSAGIPTGGLPALEHIQVDAYAPVSVLTNQGSEPNFVTYIQSSSPTFETIPGVDPGVLEELGRLHWQYLGLSADQALQISQQMSWIYFLALPPSDMDTAELIEINGQPAVALHSNNPEMQLRAVLWKMDGVLYGLYSNLALPEIMQMAESLE
ncbi:MAG: hypothetical protein ACWGO1_15415 [Anaerolineales bacterium]